MKSQTSDLLELFDSVTNIEQELISQEDRQFCEQTTLQYQTLVTQLEAYQNGLEALDKAIVQLNPATIEKSPYRCYVTTNRQMANSWIEPLAFTSVYAISYITTTLDAAQFQFNQQIVQYFNAKYNIKYELEVNNGILPWETLVKQIIDFAGGSLVDAGIRNLKTAFQNQFCYREEKKPVLKQDTITIPSTWLIGSSYSNYIDTSNNQPKALLVALSFFETGDTKIIPSILNSFPTRYDDKMEYSVFRSAAEGCAKYAGFKYYKNNRLDIKFVSATAAREFYELFVEG